MLLIQEAATKDVTYLDIPTLQNVINFKWYAYTKDFFLIDFIKTLIFLVSFIVDIINISPEGYDEES